MAKKKKPAKKPATKTRGTVKKAVKKAVKKTVKKAVKKSPGQKAAKKVAKNVKKTAPRAKAPKAPEGLRVNVTPELEGRLTALAANMDKTLAEVLTQAVTEFADTWEDHQRTVAALNDGDDRMQLVVPQE